MPNFQPLCIDGITQLRQVLQLCEHDIDQYISEGTEHEVTVTGSPTRGCRDACEQGLRVRFQQVLLQQRQQNEKAQATFLAAHREALQRKVQLVFAYSCCQADRSTEVIINPWLATKQCCLRRAAC